MSFKYQMLPFPNILYRNDILQKINIAADKKMGAYQNVNVDYKASHLNINISSQNAATISQILLFEN